MTTGGKLESEDDLGDDDERVDYISAFYSGDWLRSGFRCHTSSKRCLPTGYILRLSNIRDVKRYIGEAHSSRLCM